MIEVQQQQQQQVSLAFPLDPVVYPVSNRRGNATSHIDYFKFLLGIPRVYHLNISRTAQSSSFHLLLIVLPAGRENSGGAFEVEVRNLLAEPMLENIGNKSGRGNFLLQINNTSRGTEVRPKWKVTIITKVLTQS